MEDTKNKNLYNIVFDEFEQTKPLEKTKLKTYNDYKFSKDRAIEIPLSEIDCQDDKAFHEFMNEVTKQYQEWYIKRKDESVVDTIMLIKSGFFPTYEFYKRWYMEQESCVHNINKFKENVFMQDEWTFKGKPIVSLLDEHIYNYIMKTYCLIRKESEQYENIQR